MLFLIFQLGNDRYALDTRRIEEILPLVNWKEIPRAPAGIVGIFNYHGAPVPLVDLSKLASDKSFRARISTRIILVKFTFPNTGQTHLLGLIAEQTSETLNRPEADFVESGISAGGARYLIPANGDEKGMIQRVELERLLPAEVTESLFRQCVVSDAA